MRKKVARQRKARSGQDLKLVRSVQKASTQISRKAKTQPKAKIAASSSSVKLGTAKQLRSVARVAAPGVRAVSLKAPTANTENLRRRTPQSAPTGVLSPQGGRTANKQQGRQNGSQRPAGGLTRPVGKKPRKVAVRLQKAVAKQGVTNPALGPDQTAFVNSLASRTGLSPRVLAGMAASEQPADSPSVPGSQNWLNIGYYDSGPGAPTQDKRFFGTPEQAAKTTAQFLKGKTLGASEGIQNILSTAGKSDAAQIRAIQTSGWASSGHPNLPELAAQSSPTKTIPTKLKRTARQTIGKAPTKAILKGGKVVKDPKAGEKDAPSKADQRWGGAVGAIHAVLPKQYWSDARGDKRTPAENASVGGSPTSDHLTTNTNSFGADLPADDALARAIADNLGLASHTGTQTVEKDGVRYQLIWQDEGHYDHVHLGAQVIDPKAAPFGGSPNVPIKGTKLAVKMPVEPTGGTTAAAAGTTALAGGTATAPASGGTPTAPTGKAAKKKVVQARRRRSRYANYSPYADTPEGYYAVNPDDYQADPFLKRLADLVAAGTS